MKINCLDEIKIEASKCLKCKNPMCVLGCPAHQNIPVIFKLILDDKIDEAIKLHFDKQSIGFVCGKLCDYEKQCIGKCINKKNPIRINEVCNFLGEKRIENYDFHKKSSNNINVAIIGGGVSGLTAAELLLLNGFNVTIYDKNEKLGGVLSSLMPDFRYDTFYLDKWINNLKKLGLKTILSTEVKSLNGFDSFNYIVIAVGTTISKSTLDRKYVFTANEILSDYYNNKLDITNKKVIVSGGGNTAFDTARVLKKLNNDVTIVYRRNLKNSPASNNEIKIALNEGIKIKELCFPVKLMIENELVKGVTVQKTTLLENESGDRLSFVPLEEYEDIFCDVIVEAIGTSVDMSFARDYVSINKYGYVDNIDNGKIQVIGDAYTGAKSFVSASTNARNAVLNILKKEGFYD